MSEQAQFGPRRIERVTVQERIAILRDTLMRVTDYGQSKWTDLLPIVTIWLRREVVA